MRTDALDYPLPPARIATTPAEPRDAARLMVIRRATGGVEHRTVRDLPKLGLFAPGDLLVVNRTRVLPALFEATRVSSGGRLRGLYVESPAPGEWVVMLESRGTLQPGETFRLADGTLAELREPLGRGKWHARVASDLDPVTLLGRVGQTPLPPYIRRQRKHEHLPEVTPDDAHRYNTVYATEPGSVAAPTAGLHLTPRVLDELEALGVRRAEVVLRVGLGTFEPVRSDTLEEHAMHRESLHVPPETLAALADARDRGARVVPIGTTTVRALESLPDAWRSLPEGYAADTDLFIHPDAGFAFRFTDALLTNFHLPRSTLLALVASLPGVGIDRLMAWYRLAIDEGYRFYSYGDAMLVA